MPTIPLRNSSVCYYYMHTILQVTVTLLSDALLWHVPTKAVEVHSRMGQLRVWEFVNRCATKLAEEADTMAACQAVFGAGEVNDEYEYSETSRCGICNSSQVLERIGELLAS